MRVTCVGNEFEERLNMEFRCILGSLGFINPGRLLPELQPPVATSCLVVGGHPLSFGPYGPALIARSGSRSLFL